MGKCCGEVRTAAKAIIVRTGRLLVLTGRDRVSGEQFFSLPGGGQQRGETLSQALVRECLEEIGVTVEVGPLLFVRDSIGAGHEFADFDGDAHQTELMFACALAPGAEPTVGGKPDDYQTGTAWLPLEELASRAFYPAALVPLLTGSAPAPRSIYLGDVN